MCATLAEKGEAILFRSYDFPKKAAPVSGGAKDDYFEEIDNIDISTAGRATAAAPTYLPAVVFPEDDDNDDRETTKEGKEKLVFWDGGLLNNNPIDQLWNSRYDLVGPQDPPPGVSIIVSLGCSWNSVKPGYAATLMNTITQVSSFMTNTEAKNRDFKRYIQVIQNRNDQNALTQYERLNTPTGQKSIDLADFNKMAELKALTALYLQDSKTKEQIARIAVLLAQGGSRAREFKKLLAADVK
jgi:predicted acylesterase/phospholipase RssA